MGGTKKDLDPQNDNQQQQQEDNNTDGMSADDDVLSALVKSIPITLLGGPHLIGLNNRTPMLSGRRRRQKRAPLTSCWRLAALWRRPRH